jgi:cysteine synthase B
MLRHGSPFPASRKIVLICPAGDYSRRLAVFLTRSGYDAASLAGGVTAWRDAGLPLESSLLQDIAGTRP